MTKEVAEEVSHSEPFSESELAFIESKIAGEHRKGSDWLSAMKSLKQRYKNTPDIDPYSLAVTDAASCGLVNLDNLLDAPVETPTERQNDIWKLLRQGYTYQKIAEILETTRDSIISSVDSLNCKLGVENRYGAIAMMIKMEQRQLRETRL